MPGNLQGVSEKMFLFEKLAHVEKKHFFWDTLYMIILHYDVEIWFIGWGSKWGGSRIGGSLQIGDKAGRCTEKVFN